MAVYYSSLSSRKERVLKVRDEVTLSHDVGRALKAEGYGLADSTAEAYESIPTTKVGCWGLLYGLSAVKVPFWRRNRSLRNFIAILWIDNTRRDARISSRWVLEVHGYGFMERAQELARRLEQQFDVEIIVSLVRTDTPTEMIYSSTI